jgi:glycosyltransferase involved in cell wall biosynthesis
MFDLLFLASATASPCGVEMFARCLFDAWLEMGAPGQILPLSESKMTSEKLPSTDVLVLNLPLVAWKKSLLLPLLVLLLAKLYGKPTLAVVHEWRDLAWPRRAVFSVYLLLIDMVMFSSPTVADQFSRRALRLRNPFNAGILPIPPNLQRPLEPIVTPLSRHIADRAQGRIVIGQFGSIYPKKNSTLALELAAELKRRGQSPLVVFAGSFIKGSDQIEQTFNDKIRVLGLENDVIVSGYLNTADEVFAVLNTMDAMVYNFDEGLTSRRSSVLTCLQSGRPVIVNAPSRLDEFVHHPVFARTIATEQLHFVPNRASISDYADAVVAMVGRRSQPADLFLPAWRDAAQALARGVEGALAGRLSKVQAASVIATG